MAMLGQVKNLTMQLTTQSISGSLAPAEVAPTTGAPTFSNTPSDLCIRVKGSLLKATLDAIRAAEELPAPSEIAQNDAAEKRKRPAKRKRTSPYGSPNNEHSDTSETYGDSEDEYVQHSESVSSRTDAHMLSHELYKKHFEPPTPKRVRRVKADPDFIPAGEEEEIVG